MPVANRSAEAEELNKYKHDARIAAKELYYPQEVFDMIDEAKSIEAVSRALRHGRYSNK